MIKKVVFIAHDNYGSREIFSKLFNDHKDIEFFLIITTGLYYKKGFFSSIYKMLSEASFWFCFYRFLELMLYKLKGDTLEKRAKKWGVPVYFTADVNNAKSNNYINQISPDIIFSTFTMNILKQTTIGLSKKATIGCHPSILPNYRGLETFFWALANDEKTSGVSVFYLTEKIDSGSVIMQEPFDIEPDETLKSIYEKLTQICAMLLSKTLITIKENGTFQHYPQVGKGSYYPMPTPEAYKKFKKLGRKWL